MRANPIRTLPADVYDTLEQSALKYGGIGAGSYNRGGRPVCVFGHAHMAKLPDYVLIEAGITEDINDAAIDGFERIPFDEWCRRLNVVRGAA